MALVEVKSGRSFLGPLPPACDLVQALEDLCRQYRPAGGTFWISGVCSKLTVGTFDHRQQVYITHTEEGLFELAACHGGMAWRQATAFVWAHGVAFDDQGRACGGRLLSPTIVASGRIYLQELSGNGVADDIYRQMEMVICRAVGPNSAQGP